MTVDVTKLIRPHLAGDVQTYDPIDPPEVLAQQYGIPPERVIKLDGNENPYDNSPKVREAIANSPIQYYPDPQQRKMRDAVADYTGIGPEHIILGAGSDELIQLIFQLFVSPGDKILDFDPTFGMYGFTARVAGATIELAPRDELFEIDLDAARAAIDDRTKVIFLATPNNPTGNLASPEQIAGLLDTGRVVVADEAYFEFSGETSAQMIGEHENLVILRTMSKWAGLAGLRIGYGMMSEDLVRRIMDIKPPYNVNVAAEAALLASLEDAPVLLEKVRLIVEERERMISLLNDIPGVTPWPSSSNYVLCQFAPGKAQELYQGLARRGIFVRFFNTDRLRDCFRTSIGTPDQTDALVAALRELV